MIEIVVNIEYVEKMDQEYESMYLGLTQIQKDAYLESMKQDAIEIIKNGLGPHLVKITVEPRMKKEG